VKIFQIAYLDEEFSGKMTNQRAKRIIRDQLIICGLGVNGVRGQNVQNRVVQV